MDSQVGPLGQRFVLYGVEACAATAPRDSVRWVP